MELFNHVSVKRASSASMVVIAWAISSIFGSSDIGLDKRMEGTKCEEVPRELGVTLLVSDDEEEVTI